MPRRWGPYPSAVEYSLGMRVDYAKLIKVYRATRPDEARYSPAEVVSTEAVPVLGKPDPAKICDYARNTVEIRDSR